MAQLVGTDTHEAEELKVGINLSVEDIYPSNSSIIQAEVEAEEINAPASAASAARGNESKQPAKPKAASAAAVEEEKKEEEVTCG